MDLYSRCITGWSMSKRMTVDLVEHAKTGHHGGRAETGGRNASE